MNSNGGAHLPQDVVMAIVCEKMQWTLEEYDAQPDWFIRLLLMKWGADSEYQRKQNDATMKT